MGSRLRGERRGAPISATDPFQRLGARTRCSLRKCAIRRFGMTGDPVGATDDDESTRGGHPRGSPRNCIKTTGKRRESLIGDFFRQSRKSTDLLGIHDPSFVARRAHNNAAFGKTSQIQHSGLKFVIPLKEPDLYGFSYVKTRISGKSIAIQLSRLQILDVLFSILLQTSYSPCELCSLFIRNVFGWRRASVTFLTSRSL